MSIPSSEDEIREEIDRLASERESIALRILAVQGEIADIAHRMGNGKNTEAYVREMRTHRYRLESEIRQLTSSSIPIKARLRLLSQAGTWSAEKKAAFKKAAEETKAAAPAPVQTTDAEQILAHVRDRLLALRAEYAAFSQDPTRVSSMRLMASQFTEKLTALLKEAPKS